MSVFLILYSAVMTLVGFVPLALLAWNNVRALPVGLFAYGAFIVVSPLAWIVYLQNSWRWWVGGAVLFVVLVALTIASFRFAAPATTPRLLWSLASFLAWMFASYVGTNGISRIKSDIRMDRDLANVRAEQAETARKKADLTAHPEKRRAVLDSTMSWYLDREGVTLFLGHARYLTFGDPAKDPAGVSVWAIVTLTEYQRFDLFNHNLKKLFVELNFYLDKAGYAWPVAAGAVEARDITAAGGDAAYFGRAGERVLPQWPADQLQKAIHTMDVPPLTAPERRVHGP